MGWTTLAVLAQLVIIEGAKDGLFVYNGTPAAGNLVASIASQAGTDQFGNAYQAGIVSYSGATSWVQMLGSVLQLQNTTEVTPASISESPPGVLGFATGQQALGDTAGAFNLLSAGASATGQPLLLVGNGVQVGAPQAIVYLQASGSDDTTAVAAILAAGNTPWLLPGTWNINCGNATLTSLGPGRYILCSGDLNTIINAHGSGDLFRWVHTGSISDGTTTGGGIIGGCTIDGSACSAAAVAVHAGDINALRFDFRAQHFTKTGGAWGMLCDNANNFTERLHLNVRFKDCGFAGGDGGMIGFTVTSPGGLLTSTGSFARLKGRIEITQGSNQQDGVVLSNGAHIYDHELEIIGNFQGNATNATTAAALRITGQVPAGHPGAGTKSAISNGRLDIGIECSSATNAPTTIVQGSSSNSITSCYGNVNFNSNFTTSGITGAGFKFDGQVQGDTALGTRRYYGTAATQTITANGQTIQAIVTSAKIPVAAAASFTALILSPGDQDGQVIWLVNTSTHNQTFDVAGTSNVANGASATIAADQAMQLIWDTGTALWYEVQ